MIKQILNILRGGNTSSPPVEKLKPIPATRNVKLEVGDTVAGEFKILQIFEGGMGYVYLTQDPLEGFQFVLKTYKQELSASARQSFIKEAYSWIQIGFHPNILQAYWVRELDSKLFVAAQYIPKDDNGHNSLADYIRGGALSDKLLFSFVAQPFPFEFF